MCRALILMMRPTMFPHSKQFCHLSFALKGEMMNISFSRCKVSVITMFNMYMSGLIELTDHGWSDVGLHWKCFETLFTI